VAAIGTRNFSRTDITTILTSFWGTKMPVLTDKEAIALMPQFFRASERPDQLVLALPPQVKS
jgi:hypothetical protein